MNALRTGVDGETRCRDWGDPCQILVSREVIRAESGVMAPSKIPLLFSKSTTCS